MKRITGELKRMMGYGIAGVLATAAHYATMVALVSALATQEVVASSLGFVVGAMVKYPLNYWLVFGSRQRHRIAVPRFVLGLAFGFALNAALLALLLRIVDAHYMVSQVLTTGAVLLANYVIARLWIFRNPPPALRPGDDRR